MTAASASAPVRFVIKFAEGCGAFLSRGRFGSSTGYDFTELNGWLADQTPREAFSLFDVPASSKQNSSSLETDLGLDRFFCIILEANSDEVSSRLFELQNMPFIEEAYVEGRTDISVE